jgi:N,N'-diacetyllegionaminate synthase
VIIGAFDFFQRPFLIAEIGNNHEGDPVHARELVDAAIEAGADAIKLQIIDAERLVNRSETQRVAQLKRYRLSWDAMLELAATTRAKGRLFGASVFDCASLSEAAGYFDFIKIASGDLTFDPLLRVAARTGKPVILSTGMASDDEIVHAVEIVRTALPAGVALDNRLALAHCVSLYPAPIEMAQLGTMASLKRRFDVPVGFSDHTLGLEAAMIALGLGAQLIEKHFTIDKARSSFRDHALSADVSEFTRLAAIMRTLPAIVADKSEPPPDLANANAARRSIVAARDLQLGHVLTMDDLDFVRPANGLAPTFTASLIGRALARSVIRHERILMEDIA